MCHAFSARKCGRKSPLQRAPGFNPAGSVSPRSLHLASATELFATVCRVYSPPAMQAGYAGSFSGGSADTRDLQTEYGIRGAILVASLHPGNPCPSKTAGGVYVPVFPRAAAQSDDPAARSRTLCVLRDTTFGVPLPFVECPSLHPPSLGRYYLSRIIYSGWPGWSRFQHALRAPARSVSGAAIAGTTTCKWSCLSPFIGTALGVYRR